MEFRRVPFRSLLLRPPPCTEASMELVTKKRLKLLAGRENLPLAAGIAEFLGVELGHPDLVEFANGEIHARLGENVRGADVFIIQTHGATDDLSVNDVIMEQLIMIDAARSEEHTSELQSLMRISYDAFCLNKKTKPVDIIYILSQYIKLTHHIHRNACSH